MTLRAQTFVDYGSQDVVTEWRLFPIKNFGHFKEERRLTWSCYSRMMRITGAPSLFNYSLHYQKSVFSRRGLEPITDGAEPRPLTQTGHTETEAGSLRAAGPGW